MKIYRRIIYLILIMVLIYSGLSYGLRIGGPKKIISMDDNSLVAINENFEKLWNLTNGRFNLNEVTVNPDGVLIGKKNDLVILHIGGNSYLEVNIDGGTTWKGVALTDTP